MGKKKRLNRFITKWIKSDLPDDRSTVLLLGVTRIPTTPTAARRPCSLPLATTHYVSQNNPIVQHKSRKNCQSRRQHSLRSNPNASLRKHTSPSGASQIETVKSHRHVITKSPKYSNSESNTARCSVSSDDDITPTNTLTNSSEFVPDSKMDRSVDSIGTCSLDADVSIDLSDRSEQSSVGTLRSLTISTPEPQPYLPSYLSLACTVSGYSTSTNYDPERLSKSRDVSPHRRHDDPSLSKLTSTYQIRNNLLSPPNVVPLPHHKYTPLTSPKPKNMEEQIETRREVYTSSQISSTFTSQESNSFISSMFCNDTVDGCVKNGHPSETQSRYMSLETRNSTYMTNGSSKTVSESSYKELSNGIQQKSFIQQRVERLYGPGALAQGFFITKRQKSRSSESESDKSISNINNSEKHSQSMSDKFFEIDHSESSIKQSTSSPTLPVLRHLRPEFRAQLPIISPKKCNDVPLHKSITVPTLNEENKLNGHRKETDVSKENGTSHEECADDTIKDGHYFLRILEAETVRLLRMADKVEKELEETEDLSEEIKGKLRSASGKARLLTSQKMQQFKGLCTNNLTQKSGEAFPTTNEDLQGFWDMVLLQVEQIDQLFSEIDVIRLNNWKELDKPTPTKSLSNGTNTNKTRKAVRITSKTNIEANKEREAKRKQLLEERRKAMRQQKQNMKENIEIFVPESS
ncbi:hypothetical protein PPYR_00246 [Photinus pyralis]|nr:disks large-associated protein 4 isoform X2 [Photinus pyralis]KAB0803276.1 hypothetical protein PPYR_00246 [Photinus pyralis]